jgi:16S rRNA (cytidine1402-2'-O)-methyltransferase
VLESVDCICCEDTRNTGQLLSFYGIRKPLISLHEHNEVQRAPEVASRAHSGETFAVVTDAGMPGVSDPGQKLVDAALDAGLRVEVVPGPSAVTCALAASGLPMEHFFFEGFLPRKHGAIVSRLQELAAVPGALVVYESPHRVAATLKAAAEVFPLRRVALLRELTKLHEEVVRDLAPRLAERIAERGELKGECVIVIEGPVAGEATAAAADAPSLDEAIAQGLAEGEPKSRLAKRLSRELGIPRSEVYDRIVELT